MQKIYLCYKHVNVPNIQLMKFISPIVTELEKNYIVYCYLFQENNSKNNNINNNDMLNMFKNIDESDYFIMIADYDIDQYMLIQFGYTLHKNIPKLLFINKNMDNNIVHNMSQYIVTYTENNDIVKYIRNNYLFCYYKIIKQLIITIKVITIICFIGITTKTIFNDTI